MQSDLFKLTYDPKLAELLTSAISLPLKELKNCALGDIKDFQPLAEVLRHLDCEEFFKQTLTKATKEKKPVKLNYGQKKEKTITLEAAHHPWLVVMAATQNTMLRPSNKERKDMEDPKSFKEKRQILIDLFTKLGLHNEIKPLPQDIQQVIVGGAFGFRFISRFQYALSVIKNKKIPYLYINAGQRSLDDVSTKNGRDIGATITAFPKCSGTITKLAEEDKLKTELCTEVQLSQFIVEQFKLQDSKAFEGIKEIIYSEALPKPGAMRARTDDSADKVQEVLNKAIPANEMLLITDNPYYYQYETYLAKMKVDNLNVAIAQAMSECPICDYFDGLTRLFFTTAVRMLCTYYKLEYGDAADLASQYIKNPDYQYTKSVITVAYANPAASTTTSTIVTSV